MLSPFGLDVQRHCGCFKLTQCSRLIRRARLCLTLKPSRIAGAKLLAGGRRDGALYDATLLEKVPPQCDVVKEEVFGPLVVMDSYATFKDAVAKYVLAPACLPACRDSTD